ncbi:MAG TPA: redoxin domain-containing protein [Clostridiaceae bacterium]|nr:redoxin domain-containing protein [Clostridiaceae bacterium]
MMQLLQGFDQFTKRDTEVIVVGPDSAEKFKAFWESNDFAFYGLPDETHGVLKLYGQEVNLFKLGRMPAQMLIDKSGVLRYIHYGHSMSDIPENSEIIELIDTL